MGALMGPPRNRAARVGLPFPLSRRCGGRRCRSTRRDGPSRRLSTDSKGDVSPLLDFRDRYRLARRQTSTAAELGKPVWHIDQPLTEKFGPDDLNEMRPLISAKRCNEAI